MAGKYASNIAPVTSGCVPSRTHYRRLTHLQNVPFTVSEMPPWYHHYTFMCSCQLFLKSVAMPVIYQNVGINNLKAYANTMCRNPFHSVLSTFIRLPYLCAHSSANLLTPNVHFRKMCLNEVRRFVPSTYFLLLFIGSILIKPTHKHKGCSTAHTVFMKRIIGQIVGVD